jgi:hypothetical protein
MSDIDVLCESIAGIAARVLERQLHLCEEVLDKTPARRTRPTLERSSNRRRQ